VEAIGARTSIGPALRLMDGTELPGARFVFACGAWLPAVFPELLGQRIKPTRQVVMYFGTAAGDDRFTATHTPAWIDFASGIYRGSPISRTAASRSALILMALDSIRTPAIGPSIARASSRAARFHRIKGGRTMNRLLRQAAQSVFLVLIVPVLVSAEVSRVEVALRRDVAGGRSCGSSGPYERITRKTLFSGRSGQQAQSGHRGFVGNF